MSVAATTHPHGSWSGPARYHRQPISCPTVSWQDVTRVTRRRAVAIDTEIDTTVLVGKVLDRFNEAFGQGAARPVDLDGWVRRTLREVVALCENENAGPGLNRDNAALAALLEQLTMPVRSPALARRRKTLLRRVAEVIGGPEGHAVLALAGTESADELATRLHRSRDRCLLPAGHGPDPAPGASRPPSRVPPATHPGRPAASYGTYGTPRRRLKRR